MGMVGFLQWTCCFGGKKKTNAKNVWTLRKFWICFLEGTKWHLRMFSWNCIVKEILLGIVIFFHAFYLSKTLSNINYWVIVRLFFLEKRWIFFLGFIWCHYVPVKGTRYWFQRKQLNDTALYVMGAVRSSSGISTSVDLLFALPAWAADLRVRDKFQILV